jgi:hypothetical protein
MKKQFNHGNRLRSPEDAYEMKKQRSTERYAASQLSINPWWLHNKILRDLYNLYGPFRDISHDVLTARGFNFSKYKESKTINGQKVFLYDKHGFYLTENKKVRICKL